MSTLTWITGKQRRPISLEEKHENFIASGRKRRNASGHQGENERQPKKVKMQEYIKRVTRKFLEVSRCSRAKQRQRNVQKSVLHLQSCYFAD